MKIKPWIFISIGLLLLVYFGFGVFKKYNFNSDYEVGQPIDSLNQVIVYYNGGVDCVLGRNTTADGYNLGLKYQCVEFVKRYYYQHLNHKMPDSYGHAKDFFIDSVKDGELNTQRALLQYHNPSMYKPQVDDLIVFSGTVFNKYGHVAIISNVTDTEVEIIQQNPGPTGSSRETFVLEQDGGKWNIKNSRVKGWLRKVESLSENNVRNMNNFYIN